MDWRAYFIFSKRERIGILFLVFIMILLALLPKFWKKPARQADLVRPASFNAQPAGSRYTNAAGKRYTNGEDHYRYRDTDAFSDHRPYVYDRPSNREGYYDGYPEYDPGKYHDRYKYGDQNKYGQNRPSNQRNKAPSFYHKNSYYNDKEGRPVQHKKSPSGNSGHSSGEYPLSNPGWYYNGNSSPRRPPAMVNVNTADTTAFIALPGIGSRLASRIISFREKLGGFYTVQQVHEVYGISDSAFQQFVKYLKCDPGLIRKLNINQADKDQLRQHPYIRWNLANSLVAYRAAHGPFGSPHDLYDIVNVDSSLLKRILPYLSF